MKTSILIFTILTLFVCVFLGFAGEHKTLDGSAPKKLGDVKLVQKPSYYGFSVENNGAILKPRQNQADEVKTNHTELELRLVGTVPATYYNQAWEQAQNTKVDVLLNESGECFFAGGPGLLEMTVMVSTNICSQENTCAKIIKEIDRSFEWAIIAKTNRLCCRKPLFDPSEKKSSLKNKLEQIKKEQKQVDLLPPSEETTRKWACLLKKQSELLSEGRGRLLRGVIKSFDFKSINDGQDWMIVVELMQYTSFDPDIKESILLTIKPDDARKLQDILGKLSSECRKLQQDIKSKELLKY